jgi:A/G-specific adenine glycosylase
MDLGAMICTPRRPACGLCPLRPDCRAYAAGLAEILPYRQEKAERPVRRGAAFGDAEGHLPRLEGGGSACGKAA